MLSIKTDEQGNFLKAKDRWVQSKNSKRSSDDDYTQAWFDFCRTVFPQSVKKTGTNVDNYNVPTYQCSILFNNMCSFNWKSEFRKAENLDNPITKGEKFNVDELSLLTEFWRNNDAHVILTPEADSLPTDEKKLLNVIVLLPQRKKIMQEEGRSRGISDVCL